MWPSVDQPGNGAVRARTMGIKDGERRGAGEHFLPQGCLQMKDVSFETPKCFQIKGSALRWEMEPGRTCGEGQAGWSGCVLSADLWVEVTESGSWSGRTFQ